MPPRATRHAGAAAQTTVRMTHVEHLRDGSRTATPSVVEKLGTRRPERDETLTDEEWMAAYGMPGQLKEASKRELLEILWYVTFLLIFSITTCIGNSEQDIFYLGDKMKGQLMRQELPASAVPNIEKTLMELETLMDVHIYLQGPLYNTLYTGNSFNGTYLPGRVLYNTWMVGSPRFGTVRVPKKGCFQPDSFTYLSETQQVLDENGCFYAYETSIDQQAYGPNGMYKFNRAAWSQDTTWATDTRLKGHLDEYIDYNKNDPYYVSVSTSERYPPPSYNVILPHAEDAACATQLVLGSHVPGTSITPAVAAACPALAALHALQDNNFVDAATRALFVDLNMYNPTTKRFVITRIAFEFLQSGGVLPFLDIDIIRFYPYETDSDYVRLFGELVTFLQVLIFIVFEVYAMVRTPWRKYLNDLSRLPHLLNLTLFIVVWCITIAAIASQPKSVIPDAPDFLALRYSSDLFKTARSLNSFNMFLSWVKIFKYLRIFPVFSQLTSTLSYAAPGVAGFFLVIGIVLIGCSQAFLIAFGTRMEEYRNFQESFYALVRALLMDFDMQRLREANLWLGPLFFGTFIVLAVFVLLNMFIAIISDAYSMTQEDLRNNPSSNDITKATLLFDVLLCDMLGRLPWIGKHIVHYWRRAKQRIESFANRPNSPSDHAKVVPMPTVKQMSVTAAMARGRPGLEAELAALLAKYHASPQVLPSGASVLGTQSSADRDSQPRGDLRAHGNGQVHKSPGRTFLNVDGEGASRNGSIGAAPQRPEARTEADDLDGARPERAHITFEQDSDDTPATQGLLPGATPESQKGKGARGDGDESV